MEEKIFKTYDIRGLYQKELDDKAAYLIGRALATFLGKGAKIVVGRDGRISSPALYKKVIKGITDSGGNVLKIGLVSTPLLNFTVIKENYDGGVMVTASHNPPAYNGLKMIKRQGLQIYGNEIQEIKNLIKKEKFIKGKGVVRQKEALSNYLNHLRLQTGKIENLNVVVDYANGAAAITGKPLFNELGIKVTHLNYYIDGSFPNHLPNPIELNNMKALQKEVVNQKADLGIFFDGDGDRAFITDEKGKIVFPDILIALLATDELSKNTEKKVYFDLRFSRVTAEEIAKAGGIPRMMRVGNPFYKEKLIKEGGLMGAELSGHVMHKDNFFIDDGLFFSLKIMNLITQKNKKLSELVKPLARYYQSEEINMKVKDKEATLVKVKENFADGKSYEIDGVYVEYEDWWFSLRKSNTEDLVRLRIEASSKKQLEKKIKKIINLIKSPV